MKKLLVVFATIALFVGCGGNVKSTSEEKDGADTRTNMVNCEIEGRIDFLNEIGDVYLIDMWHAQNIIDTAKLEGNRFYFESEKREPTLARLILEGGNHIADIFIEEGKVIVSGDYIKGTVYPSGTPANEAFVAMVKRFSDISERYRRANAAGDIAAVDSIIKEHTLLMNECFEQNKDNLLGLFMLHQQSMEQTSKEVLDNLALLSTKIQTLPFAERLKSRAERKLKTEPQGVGSDYVPHYINIEQPNVKGDIVSLKSVVEDRRNRYVLLDFWASWCGPCMGEMPVLKEAYKLYHDKGFEIYGVSLDSREESWKEAITKLGITWVNVSELKELSTSAADDYAVESIPTNYLIDCSNGVIIAKNLRGQAVLDKLAMLFK